MEINRRQPLKVKYPDFDLDMEISDELKNELSNLTYDKLTTSNTTRTIKNIRKNLIASLKANYNIDKDKLNEVADKILKIHGLHENNFDFINQFESGLHENINDVSIDDNSNKNERVMRGYLNEIEKSVDKLIGYDLLYRTIKEMYGQKEAKKLTGEMYSYALGLSDSSSITVPYCWALDASKLVTLGRDFGVLKSKPAKRVSSYISMLCETIHQMSNHLAGAIAIGTFFLDLAHLMIYKERRTLAEIRSDKRIRKMIENELQQFIHSVNHLSRNGAESPFTNVSIFDTIKLRGLISDENYGWYFPNLKAISTDNDKPDKMSDEEFKNYVIDYVVELQSMYMDFFEKGDPMQNGMNYRFPVSTINFSKKLNPDTGKYEIEDINFLKAVCKRDISKFNLFNSEGTKIASCCFKGDEVIEIINENNETTVISIKDFVELYLNEPGQLKITDKIYIKSMNSDNKLDISKITGVLLKQNEHRQLVNIAVGDKHISVTPDHLLKVKHKKTGDISEIKAIDLLGKESEYLLPKII